MYVPFIGVGIGIGIECFHLISPCWVIQKRLFLSQILDDSSCAQRSGDGVFVFVNRRCDKMKILFWDRHGFWILFKRLEAGVFQMPRAERDENSIDSIKITYEQLVMILEGID